MNNGCSVPKHQITAHMITSLGCVPIYCKDRFTIMYSALHSLFKFSQESPASCQIKSALSRKCCCLHILCFKISGAFMILHKEIMTLTSSLGCATLQIKSNQIKSNHIQSNQGPNCSANMQWCDYT